MLPGWELASLAISRSVPSAAAAIPVNCVYWIGPTAESLKKTWSAAPLSGSIRKIRCAPEL
jgi:hypothetical protein